MFVTWLTLSHITLHQLGQIPSALKTSPKLLGVHFVSFVGTQMIRTARLLLGGRGSRELTGGCLVLLPLPSEFLAGTYHLQLLSGRSDTLTLSLRIGSHFRLNGK